MTPPPPPQIEPKHQATTTNLAYVTSALDSAGPAGVLRLSSAGPQTGSRRSSRLLLKPAGPRDVTTGRGLTVVAAAVFRLRHLPPADVGCYAARRRPQLRWDVPHFEILGKRSRFHVWGGAGVGVIAHADVGVTTPACVSRCLQPDVLMGSYFLRDGCSSPLAAPIQAFVAMGLQK